MDFAEQMRLALGYLREKPGLMPFRFILADESRTLPRGAGK
jgi:hypothetical protein